MEHLASGVWGWRGELRMPAGVRFPLRMTGIVLPDRSVWLHSPVALTDEMVHQIDALGPVRHIVAPSLLHHLHVMGARLRWPQARLYGAVGLKDKRPDLHVDEELGPVAPDAWQGVLVPLPIEGAPELNEVAFLHSPSRTLLVTDLVFNVLEPANLQTSLVLWITGSRGLRSSRLWRWRFTSDRAAVAASVQRILEQDFDRVVPCHGEVVERGGKPAMEAAIARLRSP